jgi:hypothetical protein
MTNFQPSHQAEPVQEKIPHIEEDDSIYFDGVSKPIFIIVS